MKKILYLLMAISSILLTISCAQEVPKHDVYVTVYPLKFLTEELFEDTNKTVDIVPGVTSHEHSAEWAPKQIIAMKEAKLLFYVGANYDQYIDKKLNVFEDGIVELIRIQDQDEYIEYIPGVIHSHEHDHEDEATTEDEDAALGIDPHFWISPKRMLDVLDLIYDQLVEKFPIQKDTIDSNYISLKASLEELHIDYEEALVALNRPVLTSTNLYGYLREDYGLDFIPISPGYHEEPDNMLPDETEKLIQEIIRHHITIIIYEKNRTSPASDNIFAEMIQLELDPAKRQFNILQALTDEEIANGKDYLTEMMANLDVLIDAGR